MNLTRQNLWNEIKDYVLITFGLACYSFGWIGFLVNNEIVTGGITGLSSLIFFGTKIPVSIIYFTINAILLILAIRTIGWQYCIRSIFGVLMMTVLVSIATAYIKEPFVKDEPFMSCIIGGILSGVGVGIAFTRNGSTGGTDIIAAIINKYKPISLGRGILYCDVCIISSSYVLFHSFEKILFGFVVLAVSTYTCDLIINGIRQSVQILIFSEDYEKIADRINKEIHRGVTILDGMGWYSKQPKKVIIVLAKRTESNSIFRMVKQIDSHAFISQSNVIGVYGEGFDKIKT
ncbi:MAG: YitT family protein [Porphyromonadaceae bacterium]|nr:YitT family protein [Porphyromonadaceae bacterium]MCD8288032.1 YitT family protein [Porphyromonadaceae bacterium]